MRHREEPLPPSQFGFASQPQFHREAKEAMLHREKREMTRINGGIVPTGGTSQADPLHVDRRSAMFAGPEARLEKISSATFLQRSQAEQASLKGARIEQLKNERLDRDARRIQGMADELAQWDEDSKKLAGTGLKNRSSVGYNFVDGTWRDSSAAARAKFHDDMVEYYARLRTQKLDQKSNTSYNILSGEERNAVTRDVIPRPQPPEEVRVALENAKTAQEQQKRLRDRPRYEISSNNANSVRRNPAEQLSAVRSASVTVIKK